jgi:hypothetical protein
MKQTIVFVTNFFKRYFPVISSTLFGALILLFVLRMVYTKPNYIATVISDDVTIIAAAFEKIDQDCSILSFEHERNFVDFFNVKSFAGSRVGPINLAYPNNWKGPYLESNPTMQEKFYEVVLSKGGLVVVPGEGVKLPNGKVVGKDIKITPKTDLEPMIKEGGSLCYGGKRLASPLNFLIGDWEQPREEKLKRMKELGDMLKRFNEAMPFAKNKDKDLRA